ncbi:MAG: hypothetical protein IKA99_03755 [Clostridia bacterium]|nr:hypothetical protein [Clostridia bacterium]
MKKLITVTIVVIMLFMSIGTMSSCSFFVPELDLDEVEEIFEELAEDLTDEDDVLNSVSVYTIRGGDAYMAGYEAFTKDAIILKSLITDFDSEDLFSFEYLCGVFECESKADAKKLYEFIYIYEYESRKTVLEYKEYLLKKYKDELSKDEENGLEESIEELEEYLQNFVVGRKGVYVWFGNKEYLKQTKGR